MSRKIIPLVAALSFGVGTVAHAQTQVVPVPVPLDPSVGNVTVKQNQNVTKIDGTILGADVKAMENPNQIKIKVRGDDGSKAQVRLPSGATSIDDVTKVKIKAPK